MSSSINRTNKGSRTERETATVLGGKRMIRSGAVGGGDIALPSGNIFGDWLWEVKSRAKLPGYFTLAMKQAEFEARSSHRRPAVVLKEDRGRLMFCAYLEDFVQWAEALAEMGRGAEARSTIRQIRTQLDALEAMTR